MIPRTQPVVSICIPSQSKHLLVPPVTKILFVETGTGWMYMRSSFFLQYTYLHTPSIPKCKVPLIFAGQRLTTLTTILFLTICP
jgi:hypothetical protein